MRKLVFLTLVISIFFSCKKESDAVPCPQPTEGLLIVGDSAFGLHPSVFIENLGRNQTGFFHDSTLGYRFLLSFRDSRMILYPDSTVYPPKNVRAPVITIPCYSAKPNSLKSGTYNYSNTTPHPANSFSHSVMTYIYWSDNFSNFYYDYPDVKTGTLTIEHVCERTYNIRLKATLIDGGRYEAAVSTQITTHDSR